jgi:hypothetical protein
MLGILAFDLGRRIVLCYACILSKCSTYNIRSTYYIIHEIFPEVVIEGGQPSPLDPYKIHLLHQVKGMIEYI